MKNRKPRILGIVLLIIALAVIAGGASAASGTTTLVSRHTNGTLGNGDSGRPSISGDGRYIAFDSVAGNLVAGDSDGLTDVFVHDRTTGQTTLVSRHANGSNGAGSRPSISADGRYVAFQSGMALVSEDTNGFVDIYLYDRQTAQTSLIPRYSGPVLGDGHSTAPSISADGQVVAFLSEATTVIFDDSPKKDVFVHDRTTGQTTLVSRHTNGTPADRPSYSLSLSGNGRFVAFESIATNLVDQPAGGSIPDIFRHDRQTGETILVTPKPPVISGVHSDPSLSADGRYVAFVTYPLSPDTDGCAERIYVRDMQTGTVTMASRSPSGAWLCLENSAPALSADGRHVAFIATTEIAFDVFTDQAYQRDLLLETTRQLSLATSGDDSVGDAAAPSVSGDGQFTAFASEAADLVAGDSNGVQDVFVREGPYTISGVIRDENSNPLAGIRVKIAALGLFTVSEADGSYRLPGLAPGQYTVEVESNEAYYFFTDNQVVSVPPHATGVDFTGTVAPVVTFSPAADAYVETASPNVNFGNEEFLYVAKSGSFEQRSYLKFNVTGLPACAQLIEADLQLIVASESPQGGQLYTAGNNWTETGITWNNAPPVTGSPIANLGAVQESDVESLDLRPAVTGNGTYTFALKDGVADEAAYWSRDNTVEVDPPWDPILRVRAIAANANAPTAAFTATPLSGQAPLAVTFTDQSTGCPTAWAWSFGDGGTSTAQNPSHTYTAAGTYTVSLTATNAQGSDGETKTAYVTVSAPPSSPSLYVSATAGGNVGGVAVTPQDILFRNGATNTWAMHFDGSDVGVTKAIAAFARLPNGELLLTLKANQSLPNVGAVTPWDVIRFIPSSLGNNTAGNFAWYIDGSDVGLTTTAEKIDALDVLPDGRVLVSTAGALAAPKQGGGTLKAQDEDLAAFNATTLGATTAGTWSLYRDLTPIAGMGAEDVTGVHVDAATGNLYVSILGAFTIGGVSGNDRDVLKLTPSGSNYTVSLYWRGGENGFNLNLGGIELP